MVGHCDLSTGKIYGCKKGSFKWFHEEGHFKFNDKFSLLILIKGYIFYFWIFFIMVSIVFYWAYPIAVCLWLKYFILCIYEEHWCNKYARKNIKNH